MIFNGMAFEGFWSLQLSDSFALFEIDSQNGSDWWPSLLVFDEVFK